MYSSKYVSNLYVTDSVIDTESKSEPKQYETYLLKLSLVGELPFNQTIKQHKIITISATNKNFMEL